MTRRNFLKTSAIAVTMLALPVTPLLNEDKHRNVEINIPSKFNRLATLADYEQLLHHIGYQNYKLDNFGNILTVSIPHEYDIPLVYKILKDRTMMMVDLKIIVI